MSWASKRQATYLSGVLLFCALVLLVLLYPRLTKAPSCFDGKMNGGEAGIDCGGACSRLCNASVSDPLVLWSRAFPVTGSNYNLVALIENPNKNAGLQYVTYEFRIYDTSNHLIGRRQGSTYIPPNDRFAIFEPRFDAGESTVRSATFEFTSQRVWIKRAPTLQTLPVHVDKITNDETTSNPTITARITNESVHDLPEFDVVIILYDEEGIAVNASKTHKDGLLSGSSEPLLFTWPQPFVGTPVRNDVILEINPFTTSF